jgi:RND family efflux transporter MFP subunit
MQRMRQFLIRISIIVAAIGVVVGAMLWLSGTFRKGRIEPGVVQPAMRVSWGKRVVRVEPIRRPYEADVVGTVQAQVRTTISARLVANIMTIKKWAGDPVAKDEVVAELDDRDLRARLEQAQQTVLAAAASRDLAKTQVARLMPLVDTHAASQSDLDDWKSRFLVGEAEVLKAMHAVEETKISLSYAKVLAPFDGIVVDRLAEPGEQASPGKALLTIYDPHWLWLEANVREAYIGYLQTKKETKEPIPVFISAIGQERSGIVQQIVPTADPVSRSVLVKVPLSDSKGLYPGMFGRMRVPIGTEARLVIPAAAVRYVGQLTLVQVIEGGQPQQRSVRLGDQIDDKLEVLAGLSAGDQVVLPD